MRRTLNITPIAKPRIREKRIYGVNMPSYDITPIPAPRLTQGALWTAKAKKYAAWKDDVRKLGIKIPESGADITFYMPVPKNGKDRIGKPHQQTPDLDNLIKALLDAVLKDDSHIWQLKASKVWATKGGIKVDYV